MAYTFTEKKRIRKDFGKRSSILDVPYLLAIQLDSYRDFLQEGSRGGRAGREGPPCRIQVRLPHRELLGGRGTRICALSGSKSPRST